MPFYYEDEIPQEEKDIIENVNNASPEESKKIIDLYEKEMFNFVEEEPGNTDETPASPDSEGATTETSNTTEGVTAEPEAPKTLEELLVPDKFNLVTINDSLLNQLPEADRNFLSGLKGERATPKMIKNHYNAEKHIFELKNKKQDEPAKIEMPKVVETKQENNPPPVIDQKDLDRDKETVLLHKLKERFPLLKDVNSIADVNVILSDLNSVNPIESAKILGKIQSLEDETTEFVTKVADFRQNYSVYNQRAIDDAFETIKAELNKLDVDVSQLGIDLNAVDENGHNVVLKSLLYKNGNVNPAIVKYGSKGTVLEGIPVINKDDILTQFQNDYAPVILKKQQEINVKTLSDVQAQLAAAREEGMREGIKQATQNIANVKSSLPVVTDGSGVGSTKMGNGKPNFADIKSSDLNSMTPAQQQEYIRYMENLYSEA